MTFYGKGSRWWKDLLTGGNPALPFRQVRHLLGLIPTEPRCKFCHAPFDGPAQPILRLIGKRRSRLSPDLCLQCEAFARNVPGGAEIELSMLFADVRGSTELAENMRPAEFGRMVNEFYVTATEIMVKTHGWVDRLVGDQVIGLYIPGFAGPDHAGLAIEASLELLKKMGHGDLDEPYLPIGAGVHTEVAFVGAVGSEEGATDITVLGEAANIAARLSSEAAAGEVLVTMSAAREGNLELEGLERRWLELSEKGEPTEVVVLKVVEVDGP